MTTLNDDDFTIINGQKVLKDGRSIKVPMTFMDGKTVDATSHRPGSHPVTDAKGREAVATAYQDYERGLNDGWRNPPPLIADEKKAPVVTDTRETAHAAMVSNLEGAWRAA